MSNLFRQTRDGLLHSVWRITRLTDKTTNKYPSSRLKRLDGKLKSSDNKRTEKSPLIPLSKGGQKLITRF